jgi:hypothetical protein
MEFLHAARGHTATPQRMNQWLADLSLPGTEVHAVASNPDRQIAARAVSVQLDETSFEGLVPEGKATASAKVSQMLRAGYSVAHMRRARVVSHELGQPHPIKAERLLAEQVQQFNGITAEKEMQELWRQLAEALSQVPGALRLLQRLDTVVARVRAKDSIALNIALLFTLYDSANAHAEAEHARRFGTLPPDQHATLDALLELHCSGQWSVRAVAAVPRAAVCALLNVPESTPEDELASTAQMYLQEAMRATM